MRKKKKGRIVFPRQKEILKKVSELKTDGLRWRWWKIYMLSEKLVFPGLLAQGLIPFSREQIISKLYQSEEFKGVDRSKKWEEDKVELLLFKLIDIAVINGQEYIWNVDYHLSQPFSFYKRPYRFYLAFLSLQDEREKALFLTLLSKFKPKGVDLNVFSIPELAKQFEDYACGRQPVFYGETKLMKGILEEIAGRVMEYQSKKVNFNESVKDFIIWWGEKVREKTKRTYVSDPKDFFQVKTLFEIFSESELRKIAEGFFNSPPVHVKLYGYTIGVFYKTVNRVLIKNSGGVNG